MPAPRPTTGHLAAPLTAEESRAFGRMFRDHERLFHKYVHRLRRKYRYVDRDEVYSCVQIAFLKSCRAYDPARGAFSSIFASFAEGEVKHFVRDNNWRVKAPTKVRERGQAARRLLAEGRTPEDVACELCCTLAEVEDAITATSPTDHEVKDFELHVCNRPTPWEWLEAQES